MPTELEQKVIEPHPFRDSGLCMDRGCDKPGCGKPASDPIHNWLDPDAALNVPFCFCTVCNHDPKYGYCWFCSCQNHIEVQPELDEEGKKLLQALRRAKQLLINLKSRMENK